MNNKYFPNFILSIILHVSIVVAFSLSYLLMPAVRFKPQVIAPKTNEQGTPKKIIEAGLISKAHVDAALKRQALAESARVQKMERELKELQKLKQQKELLDKEHKKMQQEAQVIKNESKLLQQELMLSKEKIASDAKKAQELKASLLKEQQRLEKIKNDAALESKKAEDAKKAALAAEAKKQAELKKLAKAREQAELAKAIERPVQNHDLHEAADAAVDGSTDGNQGSGQEKVDELSWYLNNMRNRIYTNRNLVGLPRGLRCALNIRLFPDGSVDTVRITESSGNAAYDHQSEAAVYKAAPFEVPKEPEVLERFLAQLRDVSLEFTIRDGE